MTNVVLIHTDDTGRFIGQYGHDIPTPNLGSLADEGVLFRQAFCTAPQCSPSRGSVMTGQYPHSNGLIGLCNGDGAFSLDDYGHHLVQYLNGHGYETVLAGQQHEAQPRGMTRHEAASEIIGYDRVLDGDESALDGRSVEDGRTTTDLANTAAAANYLRGDPAGPFFLSLGLWNCKSPQLDQTAIDPDRIRPPGPLPDVPAIREEWAGFMRNVEYVDECVGTITNVLRETGQLGDTLLIFTTDHGPQFPRMKCDLFEDGIGIALLARFPDGDHAGKVEDALVSNIDLFPTICECLDLPVPDRVQGSSLVPLVRGESSRLHDAVFAEQTYHAAYEPKRCIRTDRYKFIERFDEEYTTHVAPNTDDLASKSFLAEHGFFDRERPREALYDCYLDPSERENLVDDPAYRDVYEELSGRLRDWMAATDDPLLDGPVPKPDGADVTPRDAWSPGEGREDPGIR